MAFTQAVEKEFDNIKETSFANSPHAEHAIATELTDSDVSKPKGRSGSGFHFLSLVRPLHALRYDRQGFIKKYGAKTAVVLISSVLCISGFAVLSSFLVGRSLNECQRFLSEFSVNQGHRAELDPIEMSDCLATMCKFNYDQCDYLCPFGYTTDGSYGCTTSCQCAVEGRFQGDISFQSSQLELMLEEFGHKDSEEFSLALTHYSKLWKIKEVDGRFKVPYSLDRTLGNKQYLVIEHTFKNISTKTCLDMVPRTTEQDYVYISSTGIGCQSYVGRVGGSQEIRLAAGCFSESSVLQEVMHTFGFYHEHNREDRDAYVDIHRDNIKPYNTHNFGKLAKGYRSLDSQYDLMSPMHFSSYVFAADRYRPTIVGKGGFIIKHHKGGSLLTDKDWREINAMYDCPNVEHSDKTGEWMQWQKWSHCSETCGDGKRIRYRDCVHKPTSEKLTSGCDGRGVEYSDCKVKDCLLLEGDWAPWGTWTDCTTTCGDGIQQRNRLCTSQSGCGGYTFEVKSCDIPICNSSESLITGKTGTWTQWGNWTRCEGHCDKGQQLRTRSCELNNVQVTPKRCSLIPGLPLVDKTGQLQLQYCIPAGCPEERMRSINTVLLQSPAISQSILQRRISKWGEWGPWSRCDRTCGEGDRIRIRMCSGFFCPGSRESRESCNKGSCLSSGQLFSNIHGRAEHFCIYGTVYPGKMNQDSIPDLLCMYPDGYLEVFLLRRSGTKLQIRSAPDWEGQTGNCNFVRGSDNTQLFVQDVTLDGLDDIICYNAITKNVEVTVNQGDGTFRSEVSWKDVKEDCELVAVQDVNGDAKPDLVCKENQGMFTYLNIR